LNLPKEYPAVPVDFSLFSVFSGFFVFFVVRFLI